MGRGSESRGLIQGGGGGRGKIQGVNPSRVVCVGGGGRGSESRQQEEAGGRDPLTT